MISETFDGSPSSEDNKWYDIEHIHARWSPVASAYLVSWKARVNGDTVISERVWATAIDADGLSLTGGQAEDVSGDSGSDDGVSVAYSETSHVFITVFSVLDNDELPGARLMELVPDGSGVSINFTTDVFNLHGLETDGDGSRGGGRGAPTVAWDSSRDEFGVRWRAEDLDGNSNQQLFNVVGADGSYSDTNIVKILGAEEHSNAGRVGVAYDDYADEWVLLITVVPNDDGENELGVARMDAGDRSDVVPTILNVGSSAVGRPNTAYLGSGCSVYTWFDNVNDPYAVWAQFECFVDLCPVSEVLGSAVFSDVTLGRYYDKSIGWMYDDGLTTGTTATTFEPERAATRGEVITFLWRYEGAPAGELGSSVFGDVTAGRYYDQAIGWASETGVTTGTTATTFEPDEPITRGQMATFFGRLNGCD